MDVVTHPPTLPQSLIVTHISLEHTHTEYNI